MSDDAIPKATVQEIAVQVRDLMALRDKQLLTIAEMIRACVYWLKIDPTTYRLRGHESYTQRTEIIAENRQNKAKALLYLERLATQIEDGATHAQQTEPPQGAERQEPLPE